MSVECHPDKAALWLLAFNLCVCVCFSLRCLTATSLPPLQTLLIMSTVEDKLNVAMSKPGETSISRRTLTTIHSARSNYCIKLSWNMGKIRNTSPRHSRSLILSNGKMSLESIYFLPSNYIGPELAKVTNTFIIYKKYKWDDDQYESKIVTAILALFFFFLLPKCVMGSTFSLLVDWNRFEADRSTSLKVCLQLMTLLRLSSFPLKAPIKDQTEVKQLEVTPQPQKPFLSSHEASKLQDEQYLVQRKGNYRFYT